MTEEKIEAIALKHLGDWPLYEPTHVISSRGISNGVWLGYRKNKVLSAVAGAMWETTHFDVNIIGDTFFVLGIGVCKENRGKGHGDSLYQILEKIAKECGCKKIQMTPSGQTATGESRKDYLLRRGYTEVGIEVCKEL